MSAGEIIALVAMLMVDFAFIVMAFIAWPSRSR